MKPIPLIQKKSIHPLLLLGAGILLLLFIAGLFVVTRYLRSTSSSARWASYRSWLNGNKDLTAVTLTAKSTCNDAPFQMPIDGVIFGLWDESFRPGHRHAGIDLFPGTPVGTTPIYSVYDGYLTRESEWVSTVIIRIPSDPLQPNRQIWTYYTHMADTDGNSLISDQFPAGTTEVFIPAGTLLGYVGNYSGSPTNPTGIHLHVSVVKDKDGEYLNELDINNTYDPSPYFGLPLNQNTNPDDFPTCPIITP